MIFPQKIGILSVHFPSPTKIIYSRFSNLCPLHFTSGLSCDKCNHQWGESSIVKQKTSICLTLWCLIAYNEAKHIALRSLYLLFPETNSSDHLAFIFIQFSIVSFSWATCKEDTWKTREPTLWLHFSNDFLNVSLVYNFIMCEEKTRNVLIWLATFAQSDRWCFFRMINSNLDLSTFLDHLILKLHLYWCSSYADKEPDSIEKKIKFEK